MTSPLVDELVEQGHPASEACRTISQAFAHGGATVARRGTVSYRSWLRHRNGAVSASVQARQERDEKIVELSSQSPKFGARLIRKELEKKHHISVSVSTVIRARAREGIRADIKARPRNYPKPETGVGKDLVRRDFEADAPDMVWLTDITEFHTGEGKVYLCAVKDVFSRSIVGLAIGPRMTAELGIAAIEHAVATRKYAPHGCIVHSDRGSQFRSKKYLETLAKFGLKQSMGQVGSSADNAAMESFFGVLKNNIHRPEGYPTRVSLAVELRQWILATYNCHRGQEQLGWLSPAEFEEQFKDTLDKALEPTAG